MEVSLSKALDAVEQDDVLARSHVLRRVLRYLVDAELAGTAPQLTAYRVAVEAFGKPADFDPAASASVRVEMARLRRLLAELHERRPDLPCIEIPRGSYRPRVIAPAMQSTANPFVQSVRRATGPGVMMLGFAHLGDAGERHISFGLARMLFEELTRYRWLYIVDALDLDPRQPGLYEQCVERYECQFLLRGEVERERGGALNVHIELMDAVGRTLVWRDDFELDLAGIEDRQHEIAVNVARTLGQPFGLVTLASLNTAREHRPSGRGESADLALRFHLYMAEQRTPQLHAELKAATERVLQASPFFALGWKILGCLTRDEYTQGFVEGADRVATLTRAADHLQRALSIDPLLSRAAFLLATVRYFLGDFTGYRAWLQRALTLNPNHPEHIHWGGALLCMGGMPHEGLELVERSGLTEHHATFHRLSSLIVWIANDRMADALRVARTLPASGGGYLVQLGRAIAFATNGLAREAGEALSALFELRPVLRTQLRAAIDLWMLDAALAERCWALLSPLLQTLLAPPPAGNA